MPKNENNKKVPKKKNSMKVSKKKNSVKVSKKKNSDQISKTKMMTIFTSSASIQSTSRQDVPKPLLMDTSAVDFAKIRYEPAFLDKTILIKAVLAAESRLLLVAPRRFGKSVNLSMLKRFFELTPNKAEMKKNRELFKGTEIKQCSEIIRKHQGKYPILYLDFKSESTVKSLVDARQKISRSVQDAFNHHRYLSSESSELEDYEKTIINEWCKRDFIKNPVTEDEEIFDALKKLAIFLSAFWKEEIIVLTDEYDSICSDACLMIKNTMELELVIALCQGTLSCILKSNNTDIKIARGILTGISFVMTMGLSKLNNVEPYKFQADHQFIKFYGVTKEELGFLLKKFNLMNKLKYVVEYYNGYRHEMLSIWSVMHYLNKNVLDNYWKDSGTVSKLSEAFGTLKVRSIVLKLLSNISNTVEFRLYKKIEPIHIRFLKVIFEERDPLSENTDIFLNLLLEQGLLSVVNIRTVDKRDIVYVEAKIPNREIAAEFEEKLELFYETVYHIDFNVLKRCSLSFDKFGSSNEKNLKYVSELFKNLQAFFKTITFDITNEATFHHVMYLVTIYCKGKCYSEIHCSSRNANILDLIIFYNNGVGIIIELKIDEAIVKRNKNIKYADAGLHQILERNYVEAFENDKYNPSKIKVKYRVLMGIHIKSADKSISLSVLLNNLDYSKKINFPKL